jgi:hypothetical protein
MGPLSWLYPKSKSLPSRSQRQLRRTLRRHLWPQPASPLTTRQSATRGTSELFQTACCNASPTRCTSHDRRQPRYTTLTRSRSTRSRWTTRCAARQRCRRLPRRASVVAYVKPASEPRKPGMAPDSSLPFKSTFLSQSHTRSLSRTTTTRVRSQHRHSLQGSQRAEGLRDGVTQPVRLQFQDAAARSQTVTALHATSSVHTLTASQSTSQATAGWRPSARSRSSSRSCSQSHRSQRAHRRGESITASVHHHARQVSERAERLWNRAVQCVSEQAQRHSARNQASTTWQTAWQAARRATYMAPPGEHVNPYQESHGSPILQRTGLGSDVQMDNHLTAHTH